MLAVLFGITDVKKKKCSRSQIMPKKVLALSARAYYGLVSEKTNIRQTQYCAVKERLLTGNWLAKGTDYQHLIASAYVGMLTPMLIR